MRELEDEREPRTGDAGHRAHQLFRDLEGRPQCLRQVQRILPSPRGGIRMEGDAHH